MARVRVARVWGTKLCGTFPALALLGLALPQVVAQGLGQAFLARVAATAAARPVWRFRSGIAG